jgi:dTDP-glucose 4,6-dehydratase
MLVTGGAGFIGANFAHYWLHAHPNDRIVVLDALTYAGSLASLEAIRERPSFRFVHGDIRDTSLVTRLLVDEKLDTIVNFAAESHVDRSISGPDSFIETNVVGTHSLLKAARQTWIESKRTAGHRFHQVSTDEVYGALSFTDPAFLETTAYAPNSPYAATKAASDFLVRAYSHTYGLLVTTSNCSNNYGPFQFPEKLIPLLIVNALRGLSLPIYGDGLNVRDWLHVDDHCRAIDAIIQRGMSGTTYNVGGNCEMKNRDIAESLCDLVDGLFAARPDLKLRYPGCPAASGGSCRDLITFVADRPGHDRRYAVDATRIARDLGFRPSVGFARGLESTIEWYVENEPWWRPLLSRMMAR